MQLLKYIWMPRLNHSSLLQVKSCVTQFHGWRGSLTWPPLQPGRHSHLHLYYIYLLRRSFSSPLHYLHAIHTMDHDLDPALDGSDAGAHDDRKQHVSDDDSSGDGSSAVEENKHPPYSKYSLFCVCACTDFLSVPVPDRRTRQKLLQDDVLMGLLERCEYTTPNGYITPHTLQQVPILDDDPEEQRPVHMPGFIDRQGDDDDGRAWKCSKNHAAGDYYMASNKTSCPGCGDRMMVLLCAAGWNIGHVPRRKMSDFYIFKKVNTQYTPTTKNTLELAERVRKGGWHHNNRAARYQMMLEEQFPNLTPDDLAPFANIC